MFERFTDRARKIMALANREAQKFNQKTISPEFILLGLVNEGEGVGVLVLKEYDIDLKKIKEQIEKTIKPGPDMVTMGKLPQTSEAKKVIEKSINYATENNFNYVGSEQILAGLIRVTDSKSYSILTEVGLTEEKLNCGLEKLLGHDFPEKKTTQQTEDYWMIPREVGDVIEFLRAYSTVHSLEMPHMPLRII